MRNLNNKDLFRIMRIIRKANIKDELINMDFSGSLDDTQLGAMMILQVIESAPEAENEIFELLADIAGVSVEEIENDEFELLPKIIDHLKGQKNLVNFLQQAFKSMS